jgi:DNA-binding CsgD family transcriptional regulator
MESSLHAVRSLYGAYLTPEECDVLAVSATGRGVAESAEYLGHTSETIRRALASAVHKLGARSKLEALIIALRHGLIEPPA